MKDVEVMKKKNIFMNNLLIIIFNTRIIKLLTSLLEGTKNYQLTNDIFRSCEFPILIDRLKNIYLAYITEELKLDVNNLSVD